MCPPGRFTAASAEVAWTKASAGTCEPRRRIGPALFIPGTTIQNVGAIGPQRSDWVCLGVPGTGHPLRLRWDQSGQLPREFEAA